MTKNSEFSSIGEVLMQVPEADYGDNYKSDMLAMYRDFVASAETVSDRRNKANSFYLTSCTALLGTNTYFSAQIEGVPYALLSALLGIVFGSIWMGLIASYKSLNGAKFKVIQEMERRLPMAPYKAEEWVYKKPSTYMVRLSKFESYMPIVFIALNFGLGLFVLSSNAETFIEFFTIR
jgi:hypothetical protein